MVDVPFSKLTAAGSVGANDLAMISQLSTTVLITASTISAVASDNSINDSANGFITAGFAVGDYVKITGFTGNAANNIFSAKITALTAGKMTIGGTDGDVIVDDAAGESVTITKWVSRRATPTQFVGAGAALALLETQTPSAASQVDLESFAGGGYAFIVIIIELKVSVDNASIEMLSKHNGAYKTTVSYHRVASGTNTAGTNTRVDTSSGSAMLASLSAANVGVGNDTSEQFHSTVRTYYPDGAAGFKHVEVKSSYDTSSGSTVNFEGIGKWAGTDGEKALQGIRLRPSSGTFTGTVKVFGQK